MKRTFLFVAFALVFSCKTKDKAQTTTTAEAPKPAKAALDCSTQGMSFSAVRTIIEQNCVSCHADLVAYEKAKEIAGSGQFLASIKHERGYSSMPKDAPQLPQSQIDIVECWIKNGMKN